MGKPGGKLGPDRGISHPEPVSEPRKRRKTGFPAPECCGKPIGNRSPGRDEALLCTKLPTAVPGSDGDGKAVRPGIPNSPKPGDRAADRRSPDGFSHEKDEERQRGVFQRAPFPQSGSGPAPESARFRSAREASELSSPNSSGFHGISKARRRARSDKTGKRSAERNDPLLG